MILLVNNGDIDTFFKENESGELFLHVIPLDDYVHPIETSPSVLFIKNIITQKTYVFSLDHPDVKCVPHLKDILSEKLNKISGKKWVINKKTFYHLWGVCHGLLDVNLAECLWKNEIFDLCDFETNAHFLCKNLNRNLGKTNKVIPFMKHLEFFDDLCESVEKSIKKYIVDFPFLKINNAIIEPLYNLEKNGLFVDPVLFKKYFNHTPNESNLVYTNYNLYTSTGRPSNSFNGINYAALKRDDGCRGSFISRYGEMGSMVMIDYSAFHPRIICMLTNYSLSSSVDIYRYLATLYFNKKEVDDIDVSLAKTLTFKQLYGGIDEDYKHIKYLSNLKGYINEKWDHFKVHGYVETPLFKRKITNNHIKDPNPSKVFNYLLQAVEGEISISCLGKVISFLENKKTKPVLYTYDSVLFDFHEEDGIEIFDDIRNIMSMEERFPTKTYMGKSYQSLEHI